MPAVLHVDMAIDAGRDILRDDLLAYLLDLLDSAVQLRVHPALREREAVSVQGSKWLTKPSCG